MKKIFLIILGIIFWIIFLYFYHNPSPISCLIRSEILENDKFWKNFIKKCLWNFYFHNISHTWWYNEYYLKYDLNTEKVEFLGDFIIKDDKKVYSYNEIIKNPENADIKNLKKYIFTKDIKLFKDEKNIYLLLESTKRFKKIWWENGEIKKISDYLFADEKYLYDSDWKISESDAKNLIFENWFYKDKNFNYWNENWSFKHRNEPWFYPERNYEE